MAPTDRALLIEILRACYEAAPAPLYPAPYAQARGLDRAVLDRALDELRFKGLVRFTEWVQGRGQGYTLTQAGLDLVDHPHALERGARVPAAPAPPEPYAREPPPRRAPLLRPGRPIATWLLIAANVLVFLAGMVRAEQLEIPQTTYLNGDQTPRMVFLLRQMGSLAASDVLQRGEWWRIITGGFLHLGVFHIGLNMYALYVIGPLLEAMWGTGRLLVLYFVALIVGGCFVVWTGSAAVGASGAISGLLGSLGIWLLLNREHLPPALRSGLTRMVTTNLVILAIISVWSGISWQGHLGGAVGGALVSFPLQLSRHGDTLPLRIVGTAGAVLIGVAFLVATAGRAWGMPLPF